MTESTFDFYLLHIINSLNTINQIAFKVIKIQTNNTLMFENNQFADLKESEL